MKNAAYYQKLEYDPRVDIYETAVPAKLIIKIGDEPYELPYKHGRLMSFDWYIKCFYQFQVSDIYQDSDGSYRLHMSDESKEWFSSLGTDSVIRIDAQKLKERFDRACDVMGVDHKSGVVCYKNPAEYYQYSLEYFVEFVSRPLGGEPHTNLIDPVMCKRERFLPQQEFRLCLSCGQIGKTLQDRYGDFIKGSNESWQALFSEPVIINIGSLEDISTIVPLQKVLEDDIYL